MPMSRRITPPAISNAGKVMPKNLKMSPPARAKELSTMKQVMAARLAMRRRRPVSAPAVMARNEGTAAKGSTKKKMELKAMSENSSPSLKASCMAAYIVTEGVREWANPKEALNLSRED